MNAPALRWTKAEGDRWVCAAVGGRFNLKASPKGDGRWTWEAFAAGADDPMASGIVSSLPAAKNAAQQFLQRAGFL
jgi:hypothetical protein